MGKLHLLMKKEEIDDQKLNDEKIVIVFDVLLATSTITAALAFGAKEVIPVMNGQDALQFTNENKKKEYVLIGEYEGNTIEGFLAPNPLNLKEIVAGHSIVLSTTNGTVALKKSQNAKRVYAASILNASAVANHLSQFYKDESIILVCSGSSGQFNMEDFYGAGYFIDCLLDESCNIELSDAAKSAHYFYLGLKEKCNVVLEESNVGKMLIRYGFEEELKFVCNKSIFQVVPIFEEGKSVVNATISLES
ncbi:MULTISPECIES: 2-phosphosulfolactate phosphatase [unclassified Bacillus (in: firmicutes)]|uniref:2-phosphosulfolactate phosphatase n=1 Tax=unclassified Bacillus (in: firmicutes) TaxID=185979 RepID=UPI000BEFB3C6|nr:MULTISPECIES: 2-phosphosulfolactate phosphatase [unclassified Bacillus (in: firmicutes)]PEJ57254.1 2-phosphosulfolactate phosphatase [Bacillus sp. AFS002410]PEL13246.1 2-phosphosulfolactate phosphatase [Bacillus sp. AFS017336]